MCLAHSKCAIKISHCSTKRMLFIRSTEWEYLQVGGKREGLKCVSSSHAPGGSEHQESLGEWMSEQHLTKSEVKFSKMLFVSVTWFPTSQAASMHVPFLLLLFLQILDAPPCTILPFSSHPPHKPCISPLLPVLGDVSFLQALHYMLSCYYLLILPPKSSLWTSLRDNRLSIPLYLLQKEYFQSSIAKLNVMLLLSWARTVEFHSNLQWSAQSWH